MSEAAFDELIHAPLRLQICAMLAPVRSLPFSDIRESLDISDSVLSKHLAALGDAGYVEISRVRVDARSRRLVSLTVPGRTALRGHLAALRAIAAAAEPHGAEPHGAGPASAGPASAGPASAEPASAEPAGPAAAEEPSGARAREPRRARHEVTLDPGIA